MVQYMVLGDSRYFKFPARKHQMSADKLGQTQAEVAVFSGFVWAGLAYCYPYNVLPTIDLWLTGAIPVTIS